MHTIQWTLCQELNLGPGTHEVCMLATRLPEVFPAYTPIYYNLSSCSWVSFIFLPIAAHQLWHFILCMVSYRSNWLIFVIWSIHFLSIWSFGLFPSTFPSSMSLSKLLSCCIMWLKTALFLGTMEINDIL